MDFPIKLRGSKKRPARKSNVRKKNRGGRDLNEKFMYWQAKMAFNTQARADMYADLAVYAESGIPVEKALKQIHSAYEMQKNVSKVMIAEWIERTGSGEKFSSVLADWVPSSEATLIAGGEETGDITEALQQAATLTEKTKELKTILMSNLASPVAALVAAVFFLFYISYTVVPGAKSLLPGKYTPQFSKMYFAFGDFVVHYGYIVVILLAALIGLIVYSLPRWTGPMRARFDNFLVWKMYRGIQSGFLLITMSSMMASGMQPIAIIRELMRYATPYMRRHLSETESALSSGKKENEALNTGLLLPKMVERLHIYSILPDFSVVMHSMGDRAMEDVKRQVTASAKTLDIIIKLLLMLFVIATVFGVGMAAMAVSDAVQAHVHGG